MQASTETAVQALIKLQERSLPAAPNATRPPDDLHAHVKTALDPAPQKQTELGPVPAAAKQILQILASQHSTRCQAIFDVSHVQQLLQPSLKLFCPLETALAKGIKAASKGSGMPSNGQAVQAAQSSDAARLAVADLAADDWAAMR